VLRRKYNPNSARPRIFSGVAEAKSLSGPGGESFIGSRAGRGLRDRRRVGACAYSRKVVERHIVERASDNTIGRTLKKRSQTASQAAMGDPAGHQRGLCCDMEDVLEVYQRSHDPQRPLVCLDETSKQLIIETRARIREKPGRKPRHVRDRRECGCARVPV
jgi:hypothetical protein